MRERLLGPLLLLPLFALLVAYARELSFLCDDAYISFRYVRNLVDGHGLVFNPGEYVEGYTNFAWVLELSLIQALLGIAPAQASVALSLALTVGTGVLVVALALRTPMTSHRWAVAWVALFLYASNRSVAVWATSGLETRQFTFFVVAGVLGFSVARSQPVLALSSLCLGMAELTRPEALLIGPVVIGSWVLLAWRDGRLDPATALAAAVPAGSLVASQFAFRLAYYGAWLPNTYYAKSVRPWWEAGWTYLEVATIEHALYLLLPLAVLGTVIRAREDDWTPVVTWAFLVPLALFTARRGGDHFEWRVFDELWPFVAVWAAEPIVAGAARIARRPVPTGLLAGGAAVLLSAWWVPLQRAHVGDASALDTRKQTVGMVVPLTPETHQALGRVPGLSLLLPRYNAGLAWLADHWIAARRREHQVFAQMRLDVWGDYETLIGTGAIPDDAVAAMISVGIVPYLMPELEVIDVKGLTDATVARTPVLKPDAKRKMAHDRQARPDYLEARGVNFDPLPLRPTVEAALTAGPYAVPVAGGRWMPFDSPDSAWVSATFPDVQRRDPEFPETALDDDETPLGLFDTGLDGWTLTGAAFARQPTTGPRGWQQDLEGHDGTGLLNSFHDDDGDKALGRVTSPPFVAEPDTVLRFVVGGGKRKKTGVYLLAGDDVLGAWHGDKSEVLRPVEFDLTPHAGRTLRVQVRDDDDGGWGHVLADRFVLAPAE